MLNKKLIADLRRVQARIEAGWARGYLATKKNGDSTRVNSPEAVNFCLVGAIKKEGIREHQGNSIPRSAVGRAIKKEAENFMKLSEYASLDTINDSTNKKTVVNIIESAIKTAKAGCKNV